jgi:hypothetical protein
MVVSMNMLYSGACLIKKQWFSCRYSIYISLFKNILKMGFIFED